jgi:membrane-associated phospholipid phosphatase
MTISRPLIARGRRITSFQASLLGIATVLVAVGAAALLIDLPVARWCKAHRIPGEIGRLINLLEITGHSLGAAIGLIAAVMLDRTLGFPRPGRFGAGERAYARMIAATYLGGLLVDVVKVLVARVRPRAADLAGVGSWLGTFGDGALSIAEPRRTDLMSFPSGHSAVAAGFAAALAWRYPHGWPLFAALAAATAIQRVTTSAHYPSDVAFGAAVGLIAAACCLGGRRPGGHGVAPGTVA